MILSSALLLPLLGCSTVQSALTPPPARAVAAAPPREDVKARPKPEAAPPQPQPERRAQGIDPERLLGLNPDAVGGVLGRPDNRNKDDMAFAWTYKGQRCALELYFYPDVKTGSMRVLKYKFRHRTRGKLVNDRQCLNTITAVKK